MTTPLLAPLMHRRFDFRPDSLACVGRPGSGYLTVPFAGDVELLMRIR
jgi:hypothetical protein